MDDGAVDSRSAAVCPMIRERGQRWKPEHDQEADDSVLVAKSGKGRNYHYFPQCGALQWGHCAVSVHEARTQDCVECLQCRRQRQQGSWCERTEFPQKEWSRQAPAEVDPDGGDVSWITYAVDVKVLHWMCVSRGLDAGGEPADAAAAAQIAKRDG